MKMSWFSKKKMLGKTSSTKYRWANKEDEEKHDRGRKLKISIYFVSL